MRPAAKREPVAPTPATIAHAVPSVGSSAAEPGNGVRSEKATAATAIAASPAQPSRTFARRGTRARLGPATASAAPSPSAHVRVNGEKYGAVGWVAVARTDHASEAAA